ncbi:MAG: hypothetical protein ACE5M4_07780, partial [Anaerolineales bacterium]
MRYFGILLFLLITGCSSSAVQDQPTAEEEGETPRTFEVASNAFEILYSEDFEDGQARDWTLEPGWQVSQEGGNFVLHGQGHRWANLTQGATWGNYSFRFRLKLLSGAVHINYRLGEDGQFTRYFFGFHEGGLHLQKQIDDNSTFISETEQFHRPDAWHTVEIKGFEGHMQVFVDGELELDTTDADPLLQGTIAFETLDDAAQVHASIDDTEGQIASLLRQRARDSGPCIWGPPEPSPGVDVFEARAAANELPLFSATESGWAPNFDERMVQWGYFYGSAVRPDVSVRQMVSEDCTHTSYWRFNELYGLQIGMGVEGDLTNDLKFQYAGAVFRDETLDIAQYAIYGSIWLGLEGVDEWGGSRVFPPFDLEVDGRSGGYILEIGREDGQEQEVNLLIVPTGVRPGAVLEVGDVFSFSGNIAPTLPAHVEAEITTPSGQVRRRSSEANKIGYFYDPNGDFTVTEPGLYSVGVALRYEGMTSAGLAQSPFNTGSVLGASDGVYHFYVVPREAPLLTTELPPLSFVVSTGPVEIPLVAPQGLSNVEVHYTIHMPGWVLEDGALRPE